MDRSPPNLPLPSPNNIESPFPTSPVLNVPLDKSQQAIQGPIHILPGKPTTEGCAPEVNDDPAIRPWADVGIFKVTVRYGLLGVLADVGADPCDYVSDGITEFG